MAKKVLVIRPGHALGDAVFVSPVPRLLTEQGYEVYMACEQAVRPVFFNNPYIAGYVETPPTHELEAAQQFIENLPELVKDYDEVLHAHGHVEVGLIYRTDTVWGCVPNTTERRAKAKGVSFQDTIYKNLGLSATGVLPEFYFTDEEKDRIAELRAQLDRDGRKLIVWQWEGSTQSKILVHAPWYLRQVMEQHPNTVHYVFSDSPNLRAQIPQDDRVMDGFGIGTVVRDSIKLCQVADLVIGPESFLPCAAGAFDTPKIIFFSHTDPVNWTKYYTNCHPIKPLPSVTCYPCYLIQINFRFVYDPLRRSVAREFENACQVWNPQFKYESLGVECCYHLPHDEVLKKTTDVLGGNRHGLESRTDGGNHRDECREHPGADYQ